MSRVIPIEVKRQVLEKEKACAYCGRPVVTIVGGDAPVNQRWRALDDRGITFNFEHKVPVSAGGTSTPDNICLACPECNLVKARTHDKKAARKGKPAMTRVIKLDTQVYSQVDKLRGKGETFSDVVEILLVLRNVVFHITSILERNTGYREWQAKRLQELENTIPGGDSSEVSDV